MSLFNEMESCADPDAHEPDLVEIEKHLRKRKYTGQREKLFVLLLCIRHGLKTFFFLIGSLYNKTAGFSGTYKEFSAFPGFVGAHFRTAFGCSGFRPSSSQRSC